MGDLSLRFLLELNSADSVVQSVTDVDSVVSTDADSVGAIKLRLSCGSSVATRTFGLRSASRDRHDRPGIRVNAANCVVLGVDNKHVAARTNCDSFGPIKRRGFRLASVPAEALFT